MPVICQVTHHNDHFQGLCWGCCQQYKSHIHLQFCTSSVCFYFLPFICFIALKTHQRVNVKRKVVTRVRLYLFLISKNSRSQVRCEPIVVSPFAFSLFFFHKVMQWRFSSVTSIRCLENAVISKKYYLYDMQIHVKSIDWCCFSKNLTFFSSLRPSSL